MVKFVSRHSKTRISIWLGKFCQLTCILFVLFFLLQWMFWYVPSKGFDFKILITQVCIAWPGDWRGSEIFHLLHCILSILNTCILTLSFINGNLLNVRKNPFFTLSIRPEWHQITLTLTTISCETQAMGTVRVMGWLICLYYLMSTLATGSNYYWDNLKIKRTRIILCFPKNVNKLRIFLYFQTSSNFSILQQWIALLHESLHTGYHMKGAVKLLIITITINSNVIGASFLTNHSVQL